MQSVGRVLSQLKQEVCDSRKKTYLTVIPRAGPGPQVLSQVLFAAQNCFIAFSLLSAQGLFPKLSLVIRLSTAAIDRHRKWGDRIEHQGNIRKIPVSRSYCNIKNKIEVLVKGCICIPALDPRVVGSCSINDNGAESTVFPHAFDEIEIQVKDLLLEEFIC